MIERLTKAEQQRQDDLYRGVVPGTVKPIKRSAYFVDSNGQKHATNLPIGDGTKIRYINYTESGKNTRASSENDKRTELPARENTKVIRDRNTTLPSEKDM